MTQVYNELGKLVPVSVIQAGPCVIMQVKSAETDGYNAIQLGFDEVKPVRRKKPQIGHAKKANVEPKKFIIAQREIGIDFPDYCEALKFVVRQDPDCILIGELRDRDTMLAALQAAETGHLVLGSLHCSDAQQTFTRILEFFPRQQHQFIRSSLSSGLKAIMCQKLLPGIDKDTQFPATEVLINSSIVRDKIVREEDDDLPAIIASSHEDGMRSFTDSLCDLILTEVVHYDTAMDYAPNRDALASAVKGISTASAGLVGRLRSDRKS